MPLAESHLLRRGRPSQAALHADHQNTPAAALFNDFVHARLVVRHLRVSDGIEDCRSLAWVVMPDHLHWLIELKEVALATLMRKFKSRTAIALRRQVSGTSRYGNRGTTTMHCGGKRMWCMWPGTSLPIP